MAVAGFFGVQQNIIINNAGGAIQQLPPVTLVGGRQRVVSDRIVLAGQANGSIIMAARLPLLSALLCVTYITDTSLGSATLSVGDVNNATLYGAAATLTATNTVAFAPAAATTVGVPITSGYDCVTGLASLAYEDIVLTVGAAALPGAGNLTWQIEYVID
jgi:hypothetical protein